MSIDLVIIPIRKHKDERRGDVERRALKATVNQAFKISRSAAGSRVPNELTEIWDGKKEYRLGKTLNEAYKTWSEKLDLFVDAKTMAELLDRYTLKVIPTKTYKSQESNNISIRKLKSVFGHMPIDSVKPKHVYQYRDIRGREGKRAANMDIEVLSRCFTKAIEWGLTENHPIKGKVRKFSTPPRRAYVDEVTKLNFINSFNTDCNPDELAQDIIEIIKFDLNEYRGTPIEKAFSYLRRKVEDAGVFILMIGDLGSHHTTMDLEVYRGFAIADDIAPFVIINDKDTKSA